MLFSDLVSKQKDGKCGYNRETKDILWQNQKKAMRAAGNAGMRNKTPSVNTIRRVSSPPQGSHAVIDLIDRRNKQPTPTDEKLQINAAPTYPPPNYSMPPPVMLGSGEHLHNTPSSSYPFDAGVMLPPSLNSSKMPPFQEHSERDWGQVKPQVVPEHLHLKCLELLKDNVAGININDFLSLFEEKNKGEQFNYHQYGYNSLRDCLRTMMVSLRLTNFGKNNYMVLPTSHFCAEWETQNRAKEKAAKKRLARQSTSTKEDIDNEILKTSTEDAVSISQSVKEDKRAVMPLRETSSQLKVPIHTKEKLKKLMSFYPQGISIHDLNAVYKNVYGTDLDHMGYGYSTLIEMCESLHNIVKCIVPDNSSSYVIFPENVEIPKVVFYLH